MSRLYNGMDSLLFLSFHVHVHVPPEEEVAQAWAHIHLMGAAKCASVYVSRFTRAVRAAFQPVQACTPER